VFSPPMRGDDYTILQAICSLDMITLLIVAMYGFGGSLTAVDNLSHIGYSYGYPMVSIRTCASLLSIWNYLGRVASGYVFDIVIQKYKFSRYLLLTLTFIVSCAGHLIIALNVPNILYAASIIIDFRLGAKGPFLFAIIFELFGLN
jgi:hypothetical protein